MQNSRNLDPEEQEEMLSNPKAYAHARFSLIGLVKI
jgi:hypothetical protein